MSDWRCIAHNPASGVSTWVKEEPDGLLVQERQDISVLLDQNRAERNIASSGWKGDYHSIARIPLAMMHEKGSALAQAVAEQDSAWVSRFLNDSDNSNLRTKEGRV